jgi:hypothetical protein
MFYSVSACRGITTLPMATWILSREEKEERCYYMAFKSYMTAEVTYLTP